MRRILAVIVLAGCGSSSGSRGANGSAGSADPGDAASCEARAADLAAWATAVDRTYSGGPVMAGAELVEDRDALPVTWGRGPWTGGPGISVTHDGISVEGIPATDAKAIAASLTERRSDGPAGAVVLFIHRDAPMALVAVAASGIAAAGEHDVLLGVARPVTPMTPPPRSSVTDELVTSATGSSPGGVVAVAHVIRRMTKGCPALIRVFASPKPVPDGDKGRAIVEGLQPALVECSCNVDLDAFRSTLWALLGPGDHPPAGVVPFTLASPDDRGAAIVTGATWGDAAPALIAAAAAGRRVRFVAPASR
jgi:hypothetical protein